LIQSPEANIDLVPSPTIKKSIQCFGYCCL